VMQEMGKAMMGTGEAEGDDRALVAAQKAIANPLLDGVSMQGAKGVIVSITGGDDMRLLEVDEAANHIRELVDPDANIIWGSAFNPELEGKIRVSVVATGIESQAQTAAPVASAPAEPPRTFSFNAPRRAAEAPAAAAPQAAAPAPAPTAYQPAPEASVPQPSGAAAQAMEAGVPAAGHVPSPQAISPASEAVEDELLLGADAMMPAPAPEPAAPAAPLDQGDAGRRRFLSPGAEADDAPPQPRVKLGGTLFERMQNATRNAGRGDEEPRDPSDLPRFLHRQNNQ
jgi:cell division protein FtsZ